MAKIVKKNIIARAGIDYLTWVGFQSAVNSIIYYKDRKFVSIRKLTRLRQSLSKKCEKKNFVMPAVKHIFALIVYAFVVE